MSAWCSHLKRRALWVLACVLLAVAAAPPASAEEMPSRATAALVLRLSPARFIESAVAAHREVRVVRRPHVALPTGRAGWRERLASREQRARAQATPDARYLYLFNSTFLC